MRRITTTTDLESSSRSADREFQVDGGGVGYPEGSGGPGCRGGGGGAGCRGGRGDGGGAGYQGGGGGGVAAELGVEPEAVAVSQRRWSGHEEIEWVASRRRR
jgi:hypothetical protein